MKWHYLITATAIIIISISLPMEGKRITMVPMTARDVYRVLRQAGREDAVPEGRIVTQGIAAVSGFALGIAKGIGGSLLFDLLTANSTQQLFSGLFSGQNSGTAQQVQAQEICFNSRSLNDVYDGDDSEAIAAGRQATTTTTTPVTDYTYTTTPTSGGTDTTYVTPVTSQTTLPTTTGTNTGTDTDTSVDTGTNSGTVTDTETQTGTGDAVNCVVIQKPVAG